MLWICQAWGIRLESFFYADFSDFLHIDKIIMNAHFFNKDSLVNENETAQLKPQHVS
jgi:hypothetical protein